MAMADLDDAFLAATWDGQPPMIIDHIHDSLLVECDDADVPKVDRMMAAAFNVDRGLGVLGSEAKAGKRLSDMVGL
jgi:hypothetical protein